MHPPFHWLAQLTLLHKTFTSFSGKVSPFRSRSICSSNSAEGEAILLTLDG
jgi:hypothetical protein